MSTDLNKKLEKDVVIEKLTVGTELPQRQHTATNVSLFMYNAAVWNHHRIHYDETYTTQVEGHPAIVIDGPLQGDWLSQAALNWAGAQGSVTSFGYSNRKASYLGEVLTSGGSVSAIDVPKRRVELTLFIKNEAGEVVTPGTASVSFK
ncbi:MAG: hydroxyacyl-ACP dehydratase HTD2-like protein with hotdog domain [Candidatus Azotimanducaceae bacterium]